MKQIFQQIFIVFFITIMFAANGYSQTIRLPNNLQVSLNNDQTATVASGSEVSGDIVIPETVTFNGESYTITEISRDAFMRNENLSSVSLPQTLKRIGSLAFWQCPNLKTITGDNLTLDYIGDFAFNSTPWFDNLRVGKRVYQYIYFGKWIISHTFYPNDVYKNLSIPESTIGVYNDIPQLTVTNLHLPKSLTSIAQRTIDYAQVQTITVDKDNPTFFADDNGALYYHNITREHHNADGMPVTSSGQALYCVPPHKDSDTLHIADGTKFLLESCCARGLAKAIIVPEGVTVIEHGAFEHDFECKLFDLPSSLIDMQRAFEHLGENCEIIMRGTTIPYSDRENNFFSCGNFTVYVPNEALESYNEFFKSHQYAERFTIKPLDNESGRTYDKTDVNHDGITNSVDVVTVYNYILSGNDSGISKSQADVNSDGTINSADITDVYNYIIGSK